MAIYDRLAKFDYIEPNNLKGLQPGFVVAQEDKVDASLLKEGMFENGKICKLTADGIKPVVQGDTCPVFIHYTEPLNTIYNSDKFFAVNVAEECPRLVQLIPGDEWMSTRALTEAELMNGRIVEKTAESGWYGVKTMANGDQGHHYVFLG